ncbi:site-specific integrase [Vibrio vulnificus]
MKELIKCEADRATLTHASFHTDALSTPTVDWTYHLAFRREILAHCPDLDIPKYLLAPEIRDLAELPINDHHRMLMRLLFNCGGRINEVLALTPDDIKNAQNRTFVHLKTLKQRRRGSGRPPKGETRLIPLFDPDFARELNRYIVTHCSNRRMPIFRSRMKNKKTEAISAETARLWLKEIEMVAMAENRFILTPLSPHVLRHSFAIHLLLNGMHIKRVQSLLGHKRLSSTEIYTRLLSIDVGFDRAIRF